MKRVVGGLAILAAILWCGYMIAGLWFVAVSLSLAAFVLGHRIGATNERRELVRVHEVEMERRREWHRRSMLGPEDHAQTDADALLVEAHEMTVEAERRRQSGVPAGGRQ
jgi:hypothetical protein